MMRMVRECKSGDQPQAYPNATQEQQTFLVAPANWRFCRKPRSSTIGFRHRDALPMHEYQREFLQMAIARNALRFGEFTLKSGRKSPYFFNAGQFDHGRDLSLLGRCYAQAAMHSGLAFDALFGPAYKGIPLGAITALALAEQHGKDCRFTYNRKEAKDHGEGGTLVGAALAGRVLLVDDVITAGTAIREALGLVIAQGAIPAGVLIALDRQERGTGERSAAQELASEFNIKVVSIVGLADLIAFAGQDSTIRGHLASMQAYRDCYGV